MKFKVIIAARGGADTKSRLVGRLGPADREALVEAMLADMLAVLRGRPDIARVYVSTPTPALARVAARLGAVVLLERAGGDLNRAFETARARIAALEPGAILAFLPGDLPCLDADELAVCAAGAARGVVVLVPASADGGTGMLVMTADTPLPFAFGPDSRDQHVVAARSLGLEARVIPSPSLGFDLDRSTDLDAFLIRGGGGQTGAVLGRVVSHHGAAA